MDDEKLAAGGLIGAVVLAVVGAIYVVCNLVQCQEQWHWSGRAYEPAYTWYSNDCVYYNKNGTCRVTIPVQHNEPEKYATFYFAVYEETTRTLSYTNAGHCAPFLVSRDGRLRKLHTSGMPVGMIEGAQFQIEEAQLAPGDKLVIYSDGLTEADSRATGPAAFPRSAGNLPIHTRQSRRVPAEVRSNFCARARNPPRPSQYFPRYPRTPCFPTELCSAPSPPETLSNFSRARPQAPRDNPRRLPRHRPTSTRTPDFESDLRRESARAA
jgi:hypothetical protein